MKLGIVGLPFSGKTSLFEAITGAHRAAHDFGSSTHTATIEVPDERLDRLAAAVSPKKVTHAHIDFVDVAGVAPEQGRDRNADVLSALKEVEGLVHVVRFFDWPSAPPHPHGSLDPRRDADEVETELLLADLVIAERRIHKLEKQIAKPTPHQEQDKRELAILKKIHEGLEAGKHVSAMGLSEADALQVRAFHFLSEMPMVYVLNVHEDELDAEETANAVRSLGESTVVISAKIEKEISELDPEERPEFIEALGLTDPASKRVIRASYEAMGLRSFFTGAEQPGQELRAWTIEAGDDALTAAGKIHTDIARGFIRAEVCRWEDVLAAGSSKHARAENKMRLEGKDYQVQDGEVILFRFNV